jgi:hypothetical protein
MTDTQTELPTEFAGYRLPERDIELLTKEYGHLDPDTFRAGAETIAAAFANGVIPEDRPGTEPWAKLWDELQGKKPDEIPDALHDSLLSIDDEIRMGVYSYLSLAVQKLSTQYQSMKLGGKTNQARTKRITSGMIISPDPALKLQIEGEMIPDKRPLVLRMGNIEALVLNWLDGHGKFVHTPEESLYYLWDDRHKLYELDTERWEAFLHTLTGINPANTVFSQVKASAKTAAINNAENVTVVRMAHYDRDTQILRVSRFDGTVYALDGETITEETNGAGPVLFYDMPTWQPYKLEETTFDYLAKIGSLPIWDHDRDLYGWAFQVWLQTLFFSELCPTKPLLVMLGEKGSGKSMGLRLVLRLLFGEFAEVSGIPDKPDAFAVAANHYHLYALDNMDTLEGWMRDKLARISTGGMDEYRKLYTSKELGILRYRCWVAITARTPDTLRRDDIADRLLLLPLKRIEDDQRGRELEFMEWAEHNRNAFWTFLLARLNLVVARLRGGSIPVISPLRMADWEALGRIISDLNGKLDLWERLVILLKDEQKTFLADGEVIIEGIEAWLNNPLNPQKWVTARELYKEGQELLFGMNKPDSDWPRSVKAFGWRLKNIHDYLKIRFGMKMVSVQNGRMQKYWFDHV